MRIVGGVWSGRRLSVPAGSGVRPTADRVREAVFNMLYGIGLPDGATVVDAFCGTGALGVEALSRGAAHVTFVDTDRAVCDALAATLDELGAEPERRRIVCGDAVSFAAGAAGFDLLLADPPYGADPWPALLGLPAEPGPSAWTLVAEADRFIDVPDVVPDVVPDWESGWEQYRRRRYGRCHVTILRYRRPHARPGRRQ